jgi:hypothetical protein
MAEHCSACRFFMSGGDCARVLGRVLPQGWCKFFSQEAVQREYRPIWPMEGIPAPPGATLSLDFLTTPGTLDPRITFTRASTATYFNSAGTMQTVSGNTPRWDYDPVTHALRGLLIEEARTNALLNSATLGNQGVAVTAQTYTLSFYGTGTITMSGAFAGTLVGSGAFPGRATTTFTPAAGTLTCTVTGSVLNAQLEAGSFATSYIPTTAAAVTRAQEVCGITPGNMGFYASPGGSWELEFVALASSASNTAGIGQLGVAGSGIPVPMYFDPTLHLDQWDSVGIIGSGNAGTVGAVTKAATSVGAATGKVCLNAGAIASGGGFTNGYPALATSGVGFLAPYTAGDTQNMKAGYVRRIRYWPRVLSDAEMQQATT